MESLVVRAHPRQQWLDIAKGFGIVLVVAGHNAYLVSNTEGIYRLIYSFHIPFFFAISGVTLSTASSLTQVLNRSASLLWIYFIVGLLALPVAAHSMRWAGTFSALSGLAYGTGFTIHLVPTWFLPCLAISLPTAWLVIHFASKCHSARTSLAMIFGTCTALLAFGTALIYESPHLMRHTLAWGNLRASGAPWSSDLAPLAAGFLLLGYLFGNRIAAHGSGFRPWQIGTMTAGCAALFLITERLLSPSVDLNARLLSPPSAFLLVSILGSCAALLLSTACHNILKRITAAIGRSTLPILVLHHPIENRVMQVMSGSLEQATFVSALCAIAISVAAPALLDHFVFRRFKLGQLVFYPRRLLSQSN